jgi:glutamate---cysteine ligase / carboxylate-amine ligase
MDPDSPVVTDDAGAGVREAFEHGRPLTVGVEEELLLVDPATYDLAPVGDDIVAELGDRSRFRNELSAAQIEILTPVCTSSAEAAQAIADARRFVAGRLEGRARLAAAGAHPFARPWSDFAAGERYETIARDYRWGARTGALAAGLHVHVAVDGADRALAVLNALRGLMPELAALAAAAPLFDGRDTGLASIRPKLADALPRQGVSPAFASWDRYVRFLEWGRRSGAFADPATLWWECRLQPRLGTVEIRAPDAQAAAEDVEAVVSAAHAMVGSLCDRYDGGEMLPAYPAELIEENRWLACRDGTDGILIDLETGEPVPARRRLRELLESLEPAAAQLGGARGLERAHELAADGGAARQRGLAARRGLRGLVERLADITESA